MHTVYVGLGEIVLWRSLISAHSNGPSNPLVEPLLARANTHAS